ncbi:signal peptidase I [Chthonomonas calidirosea]|uniref:signal peptidase I n=1 Tax=Chthonomonas calidirosea TaxID=454171 RepID=UPI0006DD4E43|nr:signal peptidase I [Chthonomonas calidirosea]CEK15073.1 signal peptidase I [Chthonomonas calidirosea]
MKIFNHASDRATPSANIQELPLRNRNRYYFSLFLLLVLGYTALAFTTGYIPSSSMEPLLKPGDHVLLMRAWAAYPFGILPSRGDVVTFHFTKAAQERDAANFPGTDATSIKSGEILIKRIVALPGETVQILGNTVYINGKPLHENYTTIPVNNPNLYYPYAVLQPLTVPSDCVFVLGDNRNNSDDGRFWGPLHIRDITAKYVLTLYHTKPPKDSESQ